MPRKQTLKPSTPLVELTATSSDWDSADASLLETMLVQLHLIRAFEERVLELAADGLVHGPAHSSIGQEGGAVGSVLALAEGDVINGSHRGHHQFLAKALQHVQREGFAVEGPISTTVGEVITSTMAEILGLTTGYCKGRGGSMHLQWMEAGAMGTNAIVGGGVPQAAGFAWASKKAGTENISVTYFGDGAVNIGSVLETMNLAAAWKTPVCFFIENNRYAVSTHVSEVTAEPRLAARGLAFGIPSWRVDGMDPLAVHLAMEAAAEHMRAGNGPTIIEVDVYRFFHQNGPFPGSAFGYRTKEEEQEWRTRDPLDMVAGELLRRGIVNADAIESLRDRARALMTDVSLGLIEPDPDKGGDKMRIRPELWPSPDFRDVGVRGDLSEFAGARYAEQATFTGATKQRKFVDSVADVMNRRMSEDPSIVVMGEDIHRFNGGTNGATRDLAANFPDRTLGTPISENAFTGLACGLALDGRYRPVVEFMYPDFMWVAADQVFNQIGKARHMFGGQSAVPLVLRTKIAMGSGYGSQHLMDPAGIFATAPGWRIVAPSNNFDYVGLMNAALRCNDPVLVIEHVDLYQQRDEAPTDDLDYCIEVGKASLRREGAALTVLTYLNMVQHTLDAVEQTGVDAEVVDLRWLDQASIDWDLIGESIRKTNNVLIVEQGARGTSYGAWLSDEIQRRYFDHLDQPIQRVTGGEASPSISKVLERAAIAGTDEIADALRTVNANQGVRD
ncbi:MAG: thiamine pyrophosphate-dependent enzyme [Mycetocola sp.]